MLFEHPKYKTFMSDSVLMNWSTINKSILILALGSLGHLMWAGWYLFAFSVAEYQQWMNPEFYQLHSRMLGLFLLGYLLLIGLGFYFREHPTLQHVLSYANIFYFAITFMHGGYCIGIVSPATIASFISLVSVGLVLFERKLIYLAFIPMVFFVGISIHLTTLGELRYAPVFSSELMANPLFLNEFWVYSMVYLYSPIFIVGMVLYEILLSQWRNREHLVDQMSHTDPLTGISNRRSITNRLNDAQQNMYDYALVLLDLDHFKKVNDHYGHEVGDQVLQRIAKILKKGLRENDTVGRFGGEEFILILRENDLKRAIEIAERCRRDIANHVIELSDGRQIQITASFGVALSQPDLSKEDIIRLADEALYRAKAAGRNVVHFCDTALKRVSNA
jgi:diguanylate cyclase (GGDEF)-like protein